MYIVWFLGNHWYYWVALEILTIYPLRFISQIYLVDVYLVFSFKVFDSIILFTILSLTWFMLWEIIFLIFGWVLELIYVEGVKLRHVLGVLLAECLQQNFKASKESAENQLMVRTEYTGQDFDLSRFWHHPVY